MRITTTKNNLVAAFARISKVATASEKEKRPTSGLVCIKATSTGIYAIASTGRTTVKVPITGFTLEEGEVTTNYKNIADYFSCISEKNVSITLCTQKNALTISMNGSQVDFPIPETAVSTDILQSGENKKTTVFVKASEFENVVRSTSFVTDADANGVLKGLNVIMTPKGGMITAMSGHRILVKKFNVGDNCKETINIIIPKPTIEELIEVFKGSSSMLRIDCDKDSIMVTAEDSYFYGALMAGEYYDYRKCFSVKPCTMIEVDREALIAYLKRAAVFCTTDDVPLSIIVENGKVTAKVSSTKGKSCEEIPATIKGNNIKIGLNPNLLVRLVENVDGEKIALQFSGERTPIIAMEINKYSFMVLPMSLSDTK